MIVKYLFSTLFTLLSIQIFAQKSVEIGDHVEHKHEIGISAAPVYFFGEKELNFATHAHYVFNFRDSKFGIGAGYERVFDKHKHNFVGIELNYRPVHSLTFNISPGVTFEGKNKDEKDFAMHLETVYEFELGIFHLGPLFEIAWHPEDVHTSVGLHLGLGL